MNRAKQLVIIGAGGHGSVIADIARLNGYETILFLDDACAQRADSYPVVGKTQDLTRYVQTSDFFVAIGGNATREKLHAKLQAKLAAKFLISQGFVSVFFGSYSVIYVGGIYRGTGSLSVFAEQMKQGA